MKESAFDRAFAYFADMTPAQRATCGSIKVAQDTQIPWRYGEHPTFDKSVYANAVSFPAADLREHAVVSLHKAQQEADRLREQAHKLASALNASRGVSMQLQAAVALLAMKAGPDAQEVAETVVKATARDQDFARGVLRGYVESLEKPCRPT
jgi:hypothetical protein